MTFISNLTVGEAAVSTRTPVAAVNLVRAGVPAHTAIASERYDTLDLTLEADAGILWTRMALPGRPITSHALMADVGAMQETVRGVFKAATDTGQGRPFTHLVFGSKTPGVYNLGGDLQMFVECMRAGERERIRRYARSCVDLVHQNSVAFDLPIVTIALVQGDALGGGFEIALSWDMIVAERSAKFGLPEILFGLFPGMGAYSFLSRRIAPAKARELILGGRIHTAEELYATGIIDVLAEDGQGEAAIYDHVGRMSGKHNAERAFYNTRRRVNPVTREELRDVVDTWADAVFELGENDLRKMEYLVARQDRRMRKVALSTAA